MSYGFNLLKLIQQLNIDRSELVSKNITSTQIDKILDDQLTPQASQVLDITKKLIHHSICKNLTIDLNFERSFNGHLDCSKYKLLNLIEIEIEKSIKNENYDIEKLNYQLDYLKKTNMGYYSSHLLFKLASIFERIDEIDKEYDCYSLAFNYYFDEPLKEYFHLICEHTKRSGIVYRYLGKNHEYIAFLKELEHISQVINLPLPNKINYNLSLYYERLGEAELSIQYIDKYIKNKKFVNKLDSCEYYIQKGLILKGAGMHESAIHELEKVYDVYPNFDYLMQAGIASTNVITCVVDGDLKHEHEVLLTHIDLLKEVITRKAEEKIDPFFNYWFAIGYGYKYLNCPKLAMLAFDKAFEYVTYDHKHTELVMILHESLDVYIANHEYSNLSNVLSNVKADKMDKATMESYRKYLGKLSKSLVKEEE